MQSSMSRRRAIRQVAGLGMAGVGGRAAAAEQLPPVRTITRGPRHHWFGYYDKLQFDPAGRRVLGMAVDFEHRSPQLGDTITIGMVDLADGDRWTELGTSNAWGWQQGCMLQWRPGSADEIVWNDRVGDRFVAQVLNVSTGARRTLPRPIYTIAPNGRTAFGIDFGRLQLMRPGYGYAATTADASAVPADAGIWRIDLDTGKDELVVSVADVVGFQPQPHFAGLNHWFNHLLVNTDSTRLEFLHRCGKGGGFRTRMLTMNLDGTDRFVLEDAGMVSHFIWRDPDHILAWAQPAGRPAGFWIYRDRTRALERLGADVMTQDGHCTYLPGNRWILCDTYPDKQRLQHPYLFEIASQRRVPLGHFESPPAYTGEWRCDTHPRFSPDGRQVCIDSPVGDSQAGGQGRQMHLIDVSGIVG